ncbi:uncharacterized protein LOC6529431 [Drosophila yakuba]|uniref:Uncharacterized protein n=1 Tax=Drosophila yakuba TaxID=7245 RepID=A0A0R1DR00_DROYA|nr:uncharacterized protein LOC6529431 [Drosophila yakuba]KRJ98957.1 uncharacterized protein Dyak_GE12804 [Drosophila yakuba]
MPSSVDHVVHHVLAPMAINVLDCVVPVIRQLVIIMHQAFLVGHQESEPVIDVSGLIQPVRKIVLMVNDPTPEYHVDQEPVVNSDDINVLMNGISRSIRNLARSTYDTISAIAGE